MIKNSTLNKQDTMLLAYSIISLADSEKDMIPIGIDLYKKIKESPSAMDALFEKIDKDLMEKFIENDVSEIDELMFKKSLQIASGIQRGMVREIRDGVKGKSRVSNKSKMSKVR